MHIEKVQRLQNFAARVTQLGVRKYDHISPTIKKLKWLKVEERHVYETCILTFKVTNDHVPPWLLKFPTVAESRDRQTRQSGNLSIPMCRTDIGKRSTQVNAPQEWNKLPIKIKEATSVNTFKVYLLKHLLEKQNNGNSK